MDTVNLGAFIVSNLGTEEKEQVKRGKENV